MTWYDGKDKGGGEVVTYWGGGKAIGGREN